MITLLYSVKGLSTYLNQLENLVYVHSEGRVMYICLRLSENNILIDNLYFMRNNKNKNYIMFKYDSFNLCILYFIS